MPARRFPPPWKVCSSESAYWVEDAEGKRFGFCHFRPRETVNMMPRQGWLTEDEARRITANIARLPELLRAP